MKGIAVAGTVVALVGAGIFAGLQGLERADQFAGVGSFLLALAIAGASVVAYLRGQRQQDTPIVKNDIRDNATVITAPGNHQVKIDRRERRSLFRW